MVTQLAKKVRVAELIENVPKRKMRLQQMKELANKYILEPKKYVDKDFFILITSTKKKNYQSMAWEEKFSVACEETNGKKGM